MIYVACLHDARKSTYFDCYLTTDTGFLMGKLLTFVQTTFAEPEAASWGYQGACSRCLSHGGWECLAGYTYPTTCPAYALSAIHWGNCTPGVICHSWKFPRHTTITLFTCMCVKVPRSWHGEGSLWEVLEKFLIELILDLWNSIQASLRVIVMSGILCLIAWCLQAQSFVQQRWVFLVKLSQVMFYQVLYHCMCLVQVWSAHTQAIVWSFVIMVWRHN